AAQAYFHHRRVLPGLVPGSVRCRLSRLGRALQGVGSDARSAQAGARSPCVHLRRGVLECAGLGRGRVLHGRVRTGRFFPNAAPRRPACRLSVALTQGGEARHAGSAPHLPHQGDQTCPLLMRAISTSPLSAVAPWACRPLTTRPPRGIARCCSSSSISTTTAAAPTATRACFVCSIPTRTWR